MSLERRLHRLEGMAEDTGQRWEIPIEVRLCLKAVARHRANERGEELPAYTQEEVEAMRREDFEVACGGGIVGILRDSDGWKSEESQEILDEWESSARLRIEQTEGLPREMWGEVYEDEELDDV